MAQVFVEDVNPLARTVPSHPLRWLDDVSKVRQVRALSTRDCLNKYSQLRLLCTGVTIIGSE